MKDTVHTHEEIDVLKACRNRISFIFDNFEKVCLSFSGGKDSTVLAHLIAEECRRRSRKCGMLIVDLEAQYAETMRFVDAIVRKYDDVYETYWVCLPLHLRNAVSVFEPQWVCWDKEQRQKWVREYPNSPHVVNDQSFFPFYKYAMEFEDFVAYFSDWYAGGTLTASVVGIRTQESLNRWKAIHRWNSNIFLNKKFLNIQSDTVINAYPIYDWVTEDVWKYIGEYNLEYNRIYDLMYQAGRSIHECRICQPYGDDQRRGLDLFRKVEPETWAKVVNRVQGANFGNIYCGTHLLGNNKVILPPGMTWRKFYEFLLQTIPRWQAEWYKHRVSMYMQNWSARFEKYMSENIYKYEGSDRKAIEDFAARWRKDIDVPIEDRILDEEDPRVEGLQLAPSHRRITRCVYRNDLVMFGLGMGRVKDLYYTLNEFKRKYGE